jgi:hypothetical protein
MSHPLRRRTLAVHQRLESMKKPASSLTSWSSWTYNVHARAMRTRSPRTFHTESKQSPSLVYSRPKNSINVSRICFSRLRRDARRWYMIWNQCQKRGQISASTPSGKVPNRTSPSIEVIAHTDMISSVIREASGAGAAPAGGTDCERRRFV